MLTVSGSDALVTDSLCSVTTITPTLAANTNLTIIAYDRGIEYVVSIPQADSLELVYNRVQYIADLSSYADLKRLNLANNQLTSVKRITWPSTLQELDLSNNPLPAFEDLSELELSTLTLSNTSLTDVSSIALPSSLSTLTVSFNDLTKFPVTNAHDSLKRLYLVTNKIASFADIVIPPSLELLDLSWNKLSSFEGFELPSSVTKLFLGGNKFTSLAEFKTSNQLTTLYVHDLNLGDLEGVSFPSTVVALSLMNCSLTTLSNLMLPTSVVFLDISKNQLTALPSSYPEPMRVLTASENKLTQLTNIEFPTSATKIDLAGNSITKIAGVAFPLLLDTLLLDGSLITEFEVKRSDLPTFQKLTTFSATVVQSGCSNAAAQSVTVTKIKLCVIPDDVFAKQYGGTSSGTSPAKTTSGGGWVLPVVISCAVLAVIGVAVFIVRRRRSQRRMEKRPGGHQDYSHTLANPSVFGDLPQFEHGRNKHHDEVTMLGGNGNNMNSYSTIFTSSSSSGGSNGAESGLVKYRIPTHEITLKRPIAHGGFGAIYLALYQRQDVVVKKILPEKANDDRCLQAFLDEIKLCSTLNHPKIVRFIGVSWNTLSDIAVVLEYMACGDLDTLLKQQNVRGKTHPGEFDWYECASLPCKSAIALDILDAVVYLHSFSSPIIHRDLKAKNVLMSHNYEAKLSDFGVSKEWRVDATMTAGIGTMAWIAPEVLRGERYTEKADMYSFGVILTELATCAKPFEGITNALIVLKVTSGEQRPDMGPNCPSDIRELGMRCLSYDPGDRPSAMVAHYELKTLLKAHTRFEL